MINSIKENSLYEYIFEVDFEYPDKLHELHDYPLAPEKLKINHGVVSNNFSNKANDYGINMFFIKKIFSCICH